MPYCRHCHKEISKFDTDICPHCGEKKPIADGYRTMDITRTMDTLSQEGYELPKSRSQKTFAILCMCLGYFGIHEFYIYRKTRGILCIFLTHFFVCAVGFPLTFAWLHNALGFLIPFLIEWVFYVILGILYLKVESPKDGRGEFLR